MKPHSFMVIAGEPSGDLLAAELVRALRTEFARRSDPPSPDAQPLSAGLAPRFFGAGGRHLAAAGVELAFDLTEHSVIGPWDALKKYAVLKRLFDRLLVLACEREPEVIIGVDFSVFNRRFSRVMKERVQQRRNWFRNWNPRFVQYVSPQVWASRPGRARQLAEDLDLLLSIIPFEKAWYAEHAPKLRVEFVGHPMVDRFREGAPGEPPGRSPATPQAPGAPLIVLLPGSRRDELRRHLPVVLEAARRIAENCAARFRIVVPERFTALAKEAVRLAQLPRVEVAGEDVAASLAEAELALTKSGTITLECACFGVPSVVFYKTSWLTYGLGRLAVKTKYLAMPNLLAGEAVYPEFIQHAATPENLAQAALAVLNDAARRSAARVKLAQVVQSLGGPGASERAARAIWRLVFP